MGKTWKQFFASRWVAGFSLIIVGVLLIAYIRAYTQNNQIEQEIKRLQHEAAQWEAKKIETIELLDYVKSPAYVEEKARTELNMVKDGEQMAIVKLGKKTGDGQSEIEVLKSSKLTNLRKWWIYFFH